MPIPDHTSPLVNEFGDIRKDLASQFEVIVLRRSWDLIENGSTIEVSADVGVATAGDRETKISEVELELKEGDPKDLFFLARKIEDIVPFKIGVLSKAKRGYGLIDTLSVVNKSEPIFLDRRSTAAKGLHAILTSCFRAISVERSHSSELSKSGGTPSGASGHATASIGPLPVQTCAGRRGTTPVR
ncbi:CYTH domain-containing protein [Oryzifoliimicrobium ureilyticus]|uniref:CYTH domain-containing protein n=1 Tax=Oryzifoliimicrobium ureilyticus TaxID=3113724 RepID=UPI003075EFFD